MAVGDFFYDGNARNFVYRGEFGNDGASGAADPAAVRPNPWYGFRVPATLSNEKLWYDANANTARYLFAVGAIGLIAAIGLAYVPGLTENTYAWAFLIVFGIALAVMVILSFRYLRRLEVQ